MSFLENLTNLKSVSISYCSNIKNINAISNLTELESFYLEYGDGPCGFDGNISPLSNLTSLKTLEMRMDMDYTYFDGFIVDLTPLSNLINLEELNLDGCFVAYDISALSTLVNLKHLTLNYPYLDDISSIFNIYNQINIGGDIWIDK